MSWLREHLETFVRPVLGYIPEPSADRHIRPEQMVAVKNAWRSVKKVCGDRQLVLTGRDTYTFEILARREGYHTLYLPECSRLTYQDVKIPDVGDSLFFDVGYVGTIPKFFGADYILMSEYLEDVTKQVFPKLATSRELSIHVGDRTPKYWKRAKLVEGRIVQEYAELDEFERAAQLTIEVYTDSTPCVDFDHQRKIGRAHV